MKTVVLQRAWSDDRATLGMIKVLNHDHQPLYTLENPLRASNEDCRIPAGEYECRPYSGNKYKDVYEVQDVPERSAILFHWGNFERDTLGCILVGLSSGMMATDFRRPELGKEPGVGHSKNAFDIFRALIGKENFKLVIKDRFEE